MAMINGGHGDGPRVVLAPGSLEETFEDAWQAFNIADQLQTPVLIATDLSLALWSQSIDRDKLNGPGAAIERGPMLTAHDLQDLGETVFNRYVITHEGISPRTLPGTLEGQYLATGVEHKPDGKVSEDPKNRVAMMEKRLNKLQTIHRMREGVKWEGPRNADLVLLSMGSTVGALREAQGILQQEGHQIAVSWIRTLSPFPVDQFRQLFAGAKSVLVVEQNATGQLAQLMRAAQVYDAARFHVLLKFDGVQFFPSEIVDRARPLLKTFAEVTR
jgi:2-oxoglutarate ferredoxin oxidoreductase subunit alpha